MEYRLIAVCFAFAFAFALASSTVAAANAEVKERMANNGNVVLSGIPEIPPKLVGA